MTNTFFHVAHLELTTKCNFRCNFCPIDIINRKNLTMEKKIAFKLVEEISKHKIAKIIVYQLLGEPLLVPYLGELMEFASIKGLKNRIGSNGFLLTKNNVLMKKLEFCDNLDISLRVANQDDFSLICKSNRLSFEKYLERIRAFISEIKKYNTILTIRMFSDNSSQNILDRIGINFNVLGAPLMTPIKYDTDFYLYFEDCLSREWTYSTLSKPYFDGKCSEFYYSIVVLANGDVTICCWDFNGENVVGNIHTQKGIVNVLESNNYRKVRERFNHNIVPFKLCTTCTQLNKKGVYFEKD